MTQQNILPPDWQQWPDTDKTALLRVVERSKIRLIYENDPVAFIHDCIDWREGEGPKEYQEAALAELVQYKRLAVRGPHGPGKSAIAAWALLWFAETRDGDDWKAPTTADKWLQLREYLWPEIHKWARRMRFDVLGHKPYDEVNQLQKLRLQLSTGRAFAASPDDPTAIEGAHADRVLYVYDEAKELEEALFTATEGAFSQVGTAMQSGQDREALALVLSTPGEPSGPFYGMHRRDPKWVEFHPRHITLEEAIAAGQISRAWAEKRAEIWGEQSAAYQNRVLGEFATEDGQSVIPLRWVEQAISRWRELAVQDTQKTWAIPDTNLPAFTCVAADIAGEGEGGDQTVLGLRHGDVISEIRELTDGPELMETTGAIVGILRRFGAGYAVVDVIGLGGGIVSRLRELGRKVVGFNAAESSSAFDESGELQYANMRAEAWFGLRDRLDPNKGGVIALPPDDKLIGDLTAPRRKPTSSGKLLVESKEDIRKRIGRSTDQADTVVMAFAGARTRPMTVASPARRTVGRVR